MNNHIKNIITTIGCNEKEFYTIIEKSEGLITLSSGSFYTPFYLFDNIGLLAKYESNGKLLYNR